ncbi:hypothetical protein BCR36DRAFT_313405, partial [Piromyces finnis]
IKIIKNLFIEQYIDKLKNLISNDVPKNFDNIKEGYYEWEVDNWRSLKKEEYSPEFKLCGYYWYCYNEYIIKTF